MNLLMLSYLVNNLEMTTAASARVDEPFGLKLLLVPITIPRFAAKATPSVNVELIAAASLNWASAAAESAVFL